MTPRISLALKAAVSALLLALLFRAVPVARVLEEIRRASIPLFAAGFLVGMLSLWASAARLRTLTALQGISISVGGHLAIHLAASFYALFLPGALAGGILRWHRLYAPDRNAAGAIAVVLLNRLLSTTATAALGLVFWIAAGEGPEHGAAAAALLAALAGLVALQAGLLHPAAAAAILRRLDERSRIPRPLREGLRRAALAIGHYRGLGGKAATRIALLTAAEEALGLLAYALFARAVGVAIPVAALGWVRAFVTVATTLPVAVAGLGIREGSFALLLSSYGVPAGTAVALSGLVFARSVLLGLAGGALELRAFLGGRAVVSSRVKR